MNQTTEQILTEQKLREPDTDLDQRMASLFNESDAAEPNPPIRRTAASFWTWTAAAAAAIAVAALISSGPSQPATDELASEPVQIKETWSELEPGDLVWTDQRVPMLPVRVRTTERQQWVDPEKNVRIELTVPTEQLLFVAAPID